MPKKDPEKPKGRSSAYAFFVSKERKEKRQRNEQVDFVEFSQECSQKWKDLKDEEKQPFLDLAAQDKARYENEMAQYIPPPGAKGGGKKKRKAKKEKDPNMPKRGKSAFIIFCGERRKGIKEKNPSASIGDIAKILGEKWGKMGEKERAPFEALAEQDRDRYKREMADYRKKGSGARARVYDDDEEEEEEEEEESDE